MSEERSDSESGVKPLPESQIPVAAMSHLAQAVERDDDWTGITDARSRRKIQTRLNTRAYRQRRREQTQATAHAGPSSGAGDLPAQADPGIPCWVEDQQTVSVLPASVANSLHAGGAPVVRSASPVGGIVFPLTPDHLILLVQYNVMRACRANRDLLLDSRVFNPGTLTQCDTSITHTLEPLDSPDSLPQTLHPTDLQCTVPHDDWIDIMPHPLCRDNLIRAAGTFDDDALWADLIGGLFDGFPADEIERRGVVTWSPPWDLSGWELSEGFIRRWGWLFEGCEDFVLEATNRWRRQRGEAPVVWEIA